MYAAYFPSGDVTELGGAAAVPPAARDVSTGAHVYSCTLHFQRALPARRVMSRPSFDRSNVWNGSRAASTRPPVAAASALASLVWSKAATRVRRAGSTMMNSAPPAVVARYQKRPSSSQRGGP